MSLALQCLLRLPAGLRGQAFLDAIPQRQLSLRPDITGTIGRRAFNSTRHILQQPKISKPAGKPPAIPKSPTPPRAATPPPALPTSQPVKPKSYVDSLFTAAGGNEVLIYKAPSHRSFFFTSYIAGGLLLVGAYNWATLALKRPPGQEARGRSWGEYFLTSVSMATTLFLAIAGTAIILAPVKMIKSISALHPRFNQLGLPIMRCEMRSPLPFQKAKFIEVLPSEALLDRRVSAVEIDLTSVPLSKAQEFTASANTPITPPVRSNVIARAWNALRRDTRRMFYRDGIAYIRFKEYGNWKLDLQGCELLDNGRALERLTTPDKDRGVGLIAFLRRTKDA